VPLEIPPRPARQDTRALGIDITPLLELHARHRNVLGARFRWIHPLFYFEMLSREGVLAPEFWVRPSEWPAVRMDFEETEREKGNQTKPSETWRSRWRYLMKKRIVRRSSRDNWLDLVAFDEDVAGWPGVFVQESIYLHPYPGDISRCRGVTVTCRLDRRFACCAMVGKPRAVRRGCACAARTSQSDTVISRQRGARRPEIARNRWRRAMVCCLRTTAPPSPGPGDLMRQHTTSTGSWGNAVSAAGTPSVPFGCVRSGERPLVRDET